MIEEEVLFEGALMPAPAGDPLASAPEAVTAEVHSMLMAMPPPPRNAVPAPDSYPWSAVALLNFFRHGAFRGHATGFFVGPDLLVTAAHNLIRSQPDAVGVYPGYDAHLNPSADLGGRSWAVDSGWDVGVIVTHGSNGALMGFGGASPHNVTLAGYAYPYPSGAPRMTATSGPGSKSEHELLYPLLVDEGDSGAAVFVSGGGGAVAMAVHFDRRVQGGQSIGVGIFADSDLGHVLADLEQKARAHP